MASVTESPPRPKAGRSAGLYGSNVGANIAAASAAELIGTAILVFVITATASTAALSAPIKGTPYNSLAIVLANGLALVAMAAALGHVSGAHLNPAVTLGLAVTRRFPWRYVPSYVIFQVVGGIVGALLTYAVLGHPALSKVHLGAPAPGPGVGVGRAFVTEGLITFILTFVVISAATDERVHDAVKPIAVGFGLAAAVFIGGPVTGAGVNPARALGPMIASGSLHDWWLYVVAPIIGAVLACVIYDRFVGRGESPA